MTAGKTQFHQNLAEMPICKRAQANENYRACELHYPRRDHLALVPRPGISSYRRQSFSNPIGGSQAPRRCLSSEAAAR
jgi:hypothetical protein